MRPESVKAKSESSETSPSITITSINEFLQNQSQYMDDMGGWATIEAEGMKQSRIFANTNW